jgi:peroxiredoxin
VWERVYREWKGKGVEFVGIGLLDDREKGRAFVKRHALTFPNGWDGDGRIARAYGFAYQPYWAAVTRNGALVFARPGPSREDELISTVKSLLAR